MTQKEDYNLQLKSPEWKRKRLEIIDRDKKTCQHCSKKPKLLHVHHIIYLQGKRIWEVPNEYLITLCEDCHNAIHREFPISHFLYYQDEVTGEIRKLSDKKDLTRKEIKEAKKSKRKKKSKVKKAPKITEKQKLTLKLTSRDAELQKRYDERNKKLKEAKMPEPKKYTPLNYKDFKQKKRK